MAVNKKEAPVKKATEAELAVKKLESVMKGAEEKARTISERLNRKVVPIVVQHMEFFTPKSPNKGEYVVGFMYRPDLTTQLRLADRGQEFLTGFCQEEASKVLQALLITTESDPLINMEEEGEMYWKGAIFVLHQYVQSAIPVIKKK